MNKVGMDIVLSLPKTVSKAKSFAQRTGLRSMQNIKGTEREIIEGYRAELPHEIWGDSEKLTQWAHKKFTTLTDKNYTSFMLDERVVNRDRNEAVKAWADIIEENPLCHERSVWGRVGWSHSCYVDTERRLHPIPYMAENCRMDLWY